MAANSPEQNSPDQNSPDQNPSNIRQPRSERPWWRRWAAILSTLATIIAISALSALVPPYAAAGEQAGLPAPINVRVPALAFDERSITLVWEKPTNHDGIVDYRVYQDGQLLGSANANSTSPARPYLDAFYADPANSQQVKVVMHTFTATGLRPRTRYRFTVRSVDVAGGQSRDSAVVTQWTTPVPTVFDVTAYGAVGDATTVNTSAIQAAIDACTPDGKVRIPAGVFKTGAIWLKSDMTLEIAEGATLLGSEDPTDYPWNYLLYDYSTDQRFYSLINAHTYDSGSLTNIRIVGSGTIDGNGWKQGASAADGFPVALPSGSGTVAANGILAAAQVAKATELGSSAPYVTRSNLITLRGVTNAYYGGFTARNPSNHTLVNLDSNNVTVNGVRLTTYDINNADGIEFANGDGLTVINNVFDTGDDCMNFAAGLGAASRDQPPTRNAWIANNFFRKGHGAVVAGSHTGAWIENIVAEDNVMDHTDVGLRMKTDPNNGGGARNVLFRDNAMKAISNEGFIFTSAYSDKNAAIVVEPAAVRARFQDITVEDVTVDGTGKEAIKILGVADRPHDGIRFTGVRFINAKPTSIQYLRNSTFTDVVFDATANPWVITNSTGLSFPETTTATPVTADASSAPTWPDGAALTASAEPTSVTLTWPAALDGTGISEYRVYSGDSLLATAPAGTLTRTLTGLAPALTYDLRVEAADRTGNSTTGGPAAKVTTPGTPDTTAPVVPRGDEAVTVPVTGVGTTWASVRWTAASDDYGVAWYRVLVDGQRVASVPGDTLGYTATGLTPATSYTVAVSAVDASGNATPYTATPQVMTLPRYDTAAPRWPRHRVLRASQVGATSVTLSWTAASDDTAVTGYRVYVDGRPADDVTFTPVSATATTTATIFVVTGLSPHTRHTFRVEAGDAACRWTGSGPSITVTTRR